MQEALFKHWFLMEVRGACLTALGTAVHYLSGRHTAAHWAPTLLSPCWVLLFLGKSLESRAQPPLGWLHCCCKNKRGTPTAAWACALSLSCSLGAFGVPFRITPVTRFQSCLYVLFHLTSLRISAQLFSATGYLSVKAAFSTKATWLHAIPCRAASLTHWSEFSGRAAMTGLHVNTKRVYPTSHVTQTESIQLAQARQSKKI